MPTRSELVLRTVRWATVACLLVAVGAAAQSRLGDRSEAGEVAVVGGPTPRAVATVDQRRYVDLPPCRLVDTRVAGGKLAAGTTRTFVKTGNLTAQGGNPAGCLVAPDATSLQVNATAVAAEGTGYLRLWPSALAEPTATFMNYTSAFNVSNAGAAPTGSTGNLKAKAYAKATHLVIDVVGYYVDGVWAVVAPDGSVVDKSRSVTAVSRVTTGGYAVSVNRPVEHCAVTATLTGGGGTAEAEASSNTAIGVVTRSSTGTTANRGFNLQVEC